tara:strand:+ start:4326 stop:4679 length:354 start_codon:yes stop_codon:yes gene_type:complete
MPEFKYKKLKEDIIEKPKPIKEGTVTMATEKNDLAKEQGKLTYGQRRSEELRGAHDAPGMLYGSPAEMSSKAHPLYKKGKPTMDYSSAKLLGDLDKDGKLSSYEANRQEAIEKNMNK